MANKKEAMKTRSEITSELYLSKELASALNKMKPIELRDDLKQEMFICLCGLTDDKFWSIYDNNGLPGLKFWLVRVMLNMIHSTKANQLFYKNYRQKYESIEGFANLSEELDFKDDKELLFNKIDDNRKNLSWYEDRMLETYMELGFNQTEVSRRTQIPYQSVVKTISIIKKKLRE